MVRSIIVVNDRQTMGSNVCHLMQPTLGSCSFDEVVDAAIPGQLQFLQVYVNQDRNLTRELVEYAEKPGIKGLFITVDVPQLGRREGIGGRFRRVKAL